MSLRFTLRYITFIIVLALYLCTFNPLSAELNPICHLLLLLGAHHIFHVSGLRVKYVNTVYIAKRV